MNREQIGKIIELLESARKRPAMYIGVVSVEIAVARMNGFHAWLWAFHGELPGCRDLILIRYDVQTERGWDVNNSIRGVSHQMQERGADDKAIVDELFAIEVESWQRLAQKVDAGEIRL